MKCIKNGTQYMNVPEEVAAKNVQAGWSYCPKSEYKKAPDGQKKTIPKPRLVASGKPKRTKKQQQADAVSGKDEMDKLIDGK